MVQALDLFKLDGKVAVVTGGAKLVVDGGFTINGGF